MQNIAIEEYLIIAMFLVLEIYIIYIGL